MSLEPRPRPALASGALSLTALAAFAVELAVAQDEQSPAVALCRASIECALALAAHAWLRLRRTGRGDPPTCAGAVIFGLFMLPWLIEPIRQRLWDEGRPAELLMLNGMCYVALALGALSLWPMFQRLAGLASMFLVLFAASLGSNDAVLGLSAVYVLAGSLWLMLLNWPALRKPLNSASAVRLPWRGALAVVGCLAAVSACAAAVPQNAIVALTGFFPSSGGSEWYDPDSRGGIHDGDGIVAALHSAESVGLTDSQFSIDSQGPSLYDVFSDMYGEPQRPRQPLERMIALGPQQGEELGHEAAENLHAGRDFSTVRGRRPPPKAMSGLKAQALFYLKGRTPAHLAVTAYERFDGVRWQPIAESEPAGAVEKEGADAWMSVPHWDHSPVFGEREPFAVKLAALRTDCMPTPLHAGRFRMGKVDQPRFFLWQKPGTLRMAERTIPPGTVVDVEARAVDPQRLLEARFLTDAGVCRSETAGEARTSPELIELARAWTSGLAKGWPPIEAVVAKLKQSCALDPDAQVPADCDDSVAYFLLHSRRGPDYQFASAAAVLLRGLGYSTRLVSGFYASPLRYDKRSRHTPVTKGDVHFWLQVSLKDGTWIEIEPTPGYELAGPAPTWGGRAAALMAIVWAFACSHATMLGAFAMASLATFGRRNALIGGLATISWRLDFVGSPERRVMATLRLLERRGRLAGAPRPASQTPVQWYGRLGGMLPVSARAHLADMLAVADWHLHAPRRQWGEIPWSNEEISASCRQIAGAWTLAWLLRSQGRRRRGVIERLTAPLSSRYSRPSAKNGALVLTNGFN